MLDEVFAEAVVHAPIPLYLKIGRWALGVGRCDWTAHKVLGLRLRPFSFWHAFNLDLIGYNASKLTAFSSLLLAARCCRLRYPQSLADQNPRWHNELVTFRHERRFNRDSKFKFDQIRRFIAYRKDYADCVPEVAASEETTKLPWYLYQVSVLRQTRPDLTEAQAWNAPIAASIWSILGRMAAQGNKIDILTPEDRAQLAEIEKAQPAATT